MKTQDFMPTICAAITAQSGKPCGNGRTPGKIGERPSTSYAEAYILETLASLSDYTTGAFDMQWLTVEVHCFGQTGQQAAQLADQAREALIGMGPGGWTQPLEPAHLNVGGRLPLTNAGILETSGMHESVERFRFLVTSE